jgi:hypothetical protein
MANRNLESAANHSVLTSLSFWAGVIAAVVAGGDLYYDSDLDTAGQIATGVAVGFWGLALWSAMSGAKYREFGDHEEVAKKASDDIGI